MNEMVGIVGCNFSNDKFSLLTKNRPIASIPFGGRYRLVDFPLSNLVNAGITSVGVITPHFYRSIMDHIGAGKEWGLARKSGGVFILPGSHYGYDVENKKLTIKDLKTNIQFIEKSDCSYIVVATPCKIYNIDYNEALEYHKKNNASVTLIYKKMQNNNVDEKELVIKDDKVIDIKKAMKKLVNLYLDTMIIDKKILLKFIEWYKDNSHTDILDVIKESITHINVVGYEFKNYAKCISKLQDYVSANFELLDDKVMTELFFNEERFIKTKIHDAPPCKYSKSAKVSNSIVGTGSVVSGKISNSIIFRDCVVDYDVSIDKSIIMQGSVINRGAILKNVIIEKDVIVPSNVKFIGNEEKPLIITKEQNG